MSNCPTRASKRIANAFQRAGLGFSIGAFDFSFNEEKPSESSINEIPARLVVHLWAFSKSSEIEAARKVLKKVFPKTSKTPRPLKTYAYNGNLKAIAYAYKGDFTRRVTVPAKTNSDGKTVSRRNTRLRPLRAWQKVELAVLLNRLGLYDRLILRDVEFVRDPYGIRLNLKAE